VRRPFLYIGMLYGVGGALLAWLIITLTISALAPSVSLLAQLYGSQYALTGPSNEDVGYLLGAGIVLGWLGAWISATRHLHRIEPRA
jgi:cell division transport system permease protein